jgi:hypothetical protein
MLKQPMIEKLVAMRLMGMVEALKTQEQDAASRELSFLERHPRVGAGISLGRHARKRLRAGTHRSCDILLHLTNFLKIKWVVLNRFEFAGCAIGS